MKWANVEWRNWGSELWYEWW